MTREGSLEAALQHVAHGLHVLYHPGPEESCVNVLCESARAALALPPDPAPGMQEVERLVLDYGHALWKLIPEGIDVPGIRSVNSARAALLSAIRALAAPGPDRYAEGERAALLLYRYGDGCRCRGGPFSREAAHSQVCQQWIEAMDRHGLLPVPEPAPAGEKEGGR